MTASNIGWLIYKKTIKRERFPYSIPAWPPTSDGISLLIRRFSCSAKETDKQNKNKNKNKDDQEQGITSTSVLTEPQVTPQRDDQHLQTAHAIIYHFLAAGPRQNGNQQEADVGLPATPALTQESDPQVTPQRDDHLQTARAIIYRFLATGSRQNGNQQATMGPPERTPEPQARADNGERRRGCIYACCSLKSSTDG
eukprot:GHVU01229115.1.p1 GENE.GHVU01229115.1~~GHVU01229115.1.p1  ORF type:complete len:197 (+),score=16.27 GHVU01229115.1:434-1024(+)